MEHPGDTGHDQKMRLVSPALVLIQAGARYRGVKAHQYAQLALRQAGAQPCLL